MELQYIGIGGLFLAALVYMALRMRRKFSRRSGDCADGCGCAKENDAPRRKKS